MNDSGERSRQAAILFAAIIGGIFLTAIVFLLIYEVRGVLPPFIYAFIIVYLLRPLVNIMVKRNIPRMAAVSIVYFVVISILLLVVFFLVPVISAQIGALAENFPDYLKVGLSHFSRLRIAFHKIHFPKSLEPLIAEIGDRIKKGTFGFFSGIPETTVGVFGGIFNIILSPIIAFYILKDLPMIKETALGLFPDRHKNEILHILREVDFAVGGFLRGQVLISLIVGTTITVYLLIIGVNFAILLGMLAGILNIIPYFGPIVGGMVAAIVAAFESPRLALLVIVGMIAIQQFDGAIISPVIMKHAVNLHPTIVILALLVGGALFGFLGLILAIPFAAVAKALIYHYVYSVEITEESGETL